MPAALVACQQPAVVPAKPRFSGVGGGLAGTFGEAAGN
jgi:hypothetical protein